MRNKLKLLLIFVSLFVAFFALSVTAQADTVITATVVPTSLTSVSVDLEAGNTFLTSTQFVVKYDSKVLTFKDASITSKREGDFGNVKKIADGELLVSFFAATHAYATDLMTLNFEFSKENHGKDFGFSAEIENIYVSKDNSGADSAELTNGLINWNIPTIAKLETSCAQSGLLYLIDQASEPNYSTLSAIIRWSNGSAYNIPIEDCAIQSNFNGSKAGQYTVTVSYKNVSAKYIVMVVNNPQNAKLNIKNLPTKLEYALNTAVDAFDTAGLVVELVYADGTVEEIDISTLNFTGFDPTTTGKQTIFIHFISETKDEYVETFEIEVVELNLKVGDLDGDEGISSADARLCLRGAVGLDTLTPEQIKAADIDKDGDITSADARLILRASVG